MKTRILGILALIMVIGVACIGCTPTLVTPDGEDYSNYTYKPFQSLAYFGTTTYVAIGGDFGDQKIVAKADQAWREIQAELLAIDQAISENIPNSDIARFNEASAGEVLEIGKHTFDLLSECQEYYTLTGGHFNPAMAHHVDLWGFTPRFTAVNFAPVQPYDRENYRTQLPDDRYIQGLLPLTDFSKVKLSMGNDKYFITKPESKVEIDGSAYTMKLTLGGVGKGYACDKAKDILKKYGFNFGYVNIGSSSMSILQSIQPAKVNQLAWNVGIVHPRKAGTYLNIELANTSLSTSGDYERYYELDGNRYCHIIAPDGRPTHTGIISASAMCTQSSKCDAITTALCSMDIDSAKDFAYKSGIDISLVYQSKDGQMQYYSNHEATLLDKKISKKPL